MGDDISFAHLHSAFVFQAQIVFVITIHVKRRYRHSACATLPCWRSSPPGGLVD